MKSRIKHLFIFGLLFVCAGSLSAAVNLSTFMKEAAAKITSASSVTASFKIDAAGQPSVTGNIAVQGDRFAVTSSVNSTTFDGSTQWTVSNNDREISIFEPTDDEIAQVNPFSIIRNYGRDYTTKLISSDSSNVKVQLSPKDKNSSIKSIVITFNAAAKLPRQMAITLDDGTILHVNISEINLNANIPASRFVVNLKDYKGYEIIDLR